MVSDIGDMPSRETSTPQLAFASNIWTFMTSHILGIYPALVVILVHTQRSYISPDDRSLSTIYLSAASDQPKSDNVISRPRSLKRTRTRERETSAGPIFDIQVHELHSIRQSRSSVLDFDRTAELGDDLAQTPLSDKPHHSSGKWMV